MKSVLGFGWFLLIFGMKNRRLMKGAGISEEN